MATAKQLPSGTWRVQVYAGKDSLGKRQYVSFSAPTKKEAELAALQWQTHYKEISRDATTMTLKEAMEGYIKSKDSVLSPSTVRGYDAMMRNRLQGLMPVRLCKLTNAIIQDTINAEAAGRSAKYIYNLHGLLSATLKAYYPSFNLNVRLPQKQVFDGKYLEPEQITVLLRAVHGTDVEIPVLLAIWLGFRSSEVRGLTWDCVDFKAKTITVRQALVRDKHNKPVLKKTTKNVTSTRTVSAPDYIMDLLRFARGEAGPEDYVVTIKEETIRLHFKAILKRNGLPNIRFHDLRHCNATIQIMLGIPEKYITARNGWSTPNVLRKTYAHVMASKKNASDQQIDDYFEKLRQA